MKWYIALDYTMWIFERMHCILTYSADFWENTILGRIVWFLNLYCTRTYSTVFWGYTALRRTIWFLKEYYTRTYSMIVWENTILRHIVWFLRIYCTRTYNMIFEGILHSDIQYNFWEYYTRTYNMILKIWLWHIIIISNAMNAKLQSNTNCLWWFSSSLSWLIMMIN